MQKNSDICSRLSCNKFTYIQVYSVIKGCW